MNFEKISLYSFYCGIIFLPSALPISGFFLLIGIIFSTIKFLGKKLNIDGYDYSLIACGALMLLSNLRPFFIDRTFFIEPNDVQNLSFSMGLLDLFNWLPMFICFWVFKKYVKTKEGKESFINLSLISTIPVLISCILHFWLNIYGPFSTLNGLIVWFQKAPLPPDFELYVSGLFSNPNYLAFWLSSIWPFSLLLLRIKRNKILFLINFLLITYFIFCTGSRTAFLSILISTCILLGFKKIFYPIILFFSILGSISLSNILDLEKHTFIENINPLNLAEKFINLAINTFADSRIYIYSTAIKYISLSPLFGLGPSTFPLVYEPLEKNPYILYKPYIQHTHNIFLEIAFNYGIITALILLSFLTNILFKSIKIVYFKKQFNSNINKIWILTSITIIIFNLFDIVYYDGKFSIFTWLLIAGLKGIIEEHNVELKLTQNQINK